MKKNSIEETKEHILEIAQQEFFEKGFGAASINTIVDTARVTKPTVYYHFKNKEGLFNALVEEAYRRCYQNRRDAVDQNAPLEEQVFQVIAADFGFCLEQPELVRFVLSVTFALPGEVKTDLTEIHYRDYEFFQQIIERGNRTGEINCPDPGSAALALQGTIAINIVSFLKMGHEEDFLAPARARAIARTFLNGISQS
ncbi:MAG: TetR/AcrR family transcriptional regulator [Pyrinomonadaceae bacterium]